MEALKYLKDSVLSVVPFFIVLLVLMLISGGFVFMDYVVLTISSLIMLVGMFLLFSSIKASLEDALSLLVPALLKHSVFVILVVIFVFMFFSFLVEPNVVVFAKQFSSFASSSVLFFVVVVSLSASVFLLLSILRCVVKIPAKTAFLILYLLFFISFIFLDDMNLGAVTDSAGAATGLITVPFITSISSAIVRNINSSENDSYGHLAFSSLGVLLFVALYLMLFPSSPGVGTSSSNTGVFLSLLKSVLSSFLSLIPFAVVYFILQFTLLSSSRYVYRTRIFGFVFMSLGIILIFSSSSLFVSLVSRIADGVFKMGFVATLIIGTILGLITAFAEPSCSVFAINIENVTSGRINRVLIRIAIALGLSLTMAVFIIRLYYPFSLKVFFLFMYALILTLMFFTHPMFIGIAFDAGAVGAGVMSGVVLLPYILQIGENLPNSSTGFGIIGGVVSFPILITEILGIIYRIKINKSQKGE